MAHDILIVDDEPDIRALLDGILSDEGFATRQAANSDEALAAFRDRRPSLVILDIWLQNSRLDGLGILEDEAAQFQLVHDAVAQAIAGQTGVDAFYAGLLPEDADARARAERRSVLRGGPHPFDLIDGTGIEALLVDHAGNVTCSPGFTDCSGTVRPRTETPTSFTDSGSPDTSGCHQASPRPSAIRR